MERSQKLFECLNKWSEPVVDSRRIGGESLSKEGAAAARLLQSGSIAGGQVQIFRRIGRGLLEGGVYSLKYGNQTSRISHRVWACMGECLIMLFYSIT